MIRVPEEDYNRLRSVQLLLLNKGLEAVDWTVLRQQTLVKPPEPPESEDGSTGLTWGFVIGAGAAALAHLISCGLKERSGLGIAESKVETPPTNPVPHQK